MNLTRTLGNMLTDNGVQQYTAITIWSTQLRTPPLECEFVLVRRASLSNGSEDVRSPSESITLSAEATRAAEVGNRRRLLQNTTSPAVPDFTVDIRVSIDFAAEFADDAGDIIRGLAQFPEIVSVDFDSVQIIEPPDTTPPPEEVDECTADEFCLWSRNLIVVLAAGGAVVLLCCIFGVYKCLLESEKNDLEKGIYGGSSDWRARRAQNFDFRAMGRNGISERVIMQMRDEIVEEVMANDQSGTGEEEEEETSVTSGTHTTDESEEEEDEDEEELYSRESQEAGSRATPEHDWASRNQGSEEDVWDRKPPLRPYQGSFNRTLPPPLPPNGPAAAVPQYSHPQTLLFPQPNWNAGPPAQQYPPLKAVEGFGVGPGMANPVPVQQKRPVDENPIQAIGGLLSFLLPQDTTTASSTANNNVGQRPPARNNLNAPPDASGSGAANQVQGSFRTDSGERLQRWVRGARSLSIDDVPADLDDDMQPRPRPRPRPRRNSRGSLRSTDTRRTRESRRSRESHRDRDRDRRRYESEDSEDRSSEAYSDEGRRQGGRDRHGRRRHDDDARSMRSGRSGRSGRSSRSRRMNRRGEMEGEREWRERRRRRAEEEEEEEERRMPRRRNDDKRSVAGSQQSTLSQRDQAREMARKAREEAMFWVM